MFADIVATLRVAVAGFAIAGVVGVILPFLLRRSPRATEAVEPAIMFTMGIPKYALAPWLILWFGIGDMPKLVVVALVVFYIVFITTFAGIRGVDRRLISMARVIGASERTHLARDHLDVAAAVLLHRAEDRVPARGERHHRGRIPGLDAGRRPLYRRRAAGLRHHRRVRRRRDRAGAGAGHQCACSTRIERWALRWRPVEREMELYCEMPLVPEAGTD